MAKNNNNKKRQETGGLQAPKMTVAEKEELKEVKAKARKKEKVKKDKGDRPNFFVRIGRGFRGIFEELKKVRWPTFAKTVAKTGVVLGVVLIFSLVVFGIDQGLSQLYRLLTRNL